MSCQLPRTNVGINEFITVTLLYFYVLGVWIPLLIFWVSIVCITYKNYCRYIILVWCIYLSIYLSDLQIRFVTVTRILYKIIVCFFYFFNSHTKNIPMTLGTLQTHAETDTKNTQNQNKNLSAVPCGVWIHNTERSRNLRRDRPQPQHYASNLTRMQSEIFLKVCFYLIMFKICML